MTLITLTTYFSLSIYMDREKDTFREMCAYQSLTIEAEESLRNEEGSGNSKSFSASEYAFGLVQSKGSK